MLPITLVVPVFNARARVNQILPALLALNPGAQRYVFVDDGSSDDTFQLLSQACQGDDRFVVLTQPNRGPAAARNRGIQAALGEWVAFTDDDCLPTPGWLGELWKCSQLHPGVSVVFGSIHATGTKSYMSHYVENVGQGHQTANAFYRLSVLQQVGGFDERFLTPYLEDTDLFLAVQPLGFSAFAPNAVVAHPVRPAGLVSRVKRMRYYANDFLLYHKHPVQYKERHRGLGPAGYLLYYVGLKHGLAVFLASCRGLLARPQEFLRIALTLLLERVYLAYLLGIWLRKPPQAAHR